MLSACWVHHSVGSLSPRAAVGSVGTRVEKAAD